MRAYSSRCCSQRSQRLCGHRWMAYGFVSAVLFNVRRALWRGSTIVVSPFQGRQDIRQCLAHFIHFHPRRLYPRSSESDFVARSRQPLLHMNDLSVRFTRWSYCMPNHVLPNPGLSGTDLLVNNSNSGLSRSFEGKLSV